MGSQAQVVKVGARGLGKTTIYYSQAFVGEFPFRELPPSVRTVRTVEYRTGPYSIWCSHDNDIGSWLSGDTCSRTYRAVQYLGVLYPQRDTVQPCTVPYTGTVFKNNFFIVKNSSFSKYVRVCSVHRFHVYGERAPRGREQHVPAVSDIVPLGTARGESIAAAARYRTGSTYSPLEVDYMQCGACWVGTVL